MNPTPSPLPPKMLHGADYNPEQWHLDPNILDADFAAMKLAGCNSMSVGIFAWSLYEPEEGKFDFDWMARLLDRFEQEGIQATLATPTGSKPMWMSEAYPEIRRVDASGHRERSGQRHNHCPSSPVYRESGLCGRIPASERIRTDTARLGKSVGD